MGDKIVWNENGNSLYHGEIIGFIINPDQRPCAVIRTIFGRYILKLLEDIRHDG